MGKTPSRPLTEADLDAASGGKASTTARDESPDKRPVAPAPPAPIEELVAVEPVKAPVVAEMPQVLTREHALAKAPHPLDIAGNNSKLVVVDGEGGGRQVILALTDTDDRPRVLPRPNPAYALPAGTKIYKMGARQFVGVLPLDTGGEKQVQGASTNAVIAELSHLVHDRATGANE